MIKRVLAFALSIMITFFASGCSSAAADENAKESAAEEKKGFVVSEELQESMSKDNSSDEGDDKGFDVSGLDTSEHVVITYLTIGDKPSGKAEERLLATIAELMRF